MIVETMRPETRDTLLLLLLSAAIHVAGVTAALVYLQRHPVDLPLQAATVEPKRPAAIAAMPELESDAVPSVVPEAVPEIVWGIPGEAGTAITGVEADSEQSATKEEFEQAFTRQTSTDRASAAARMKSTADSRADPAPAASSPRQADTLGPASIASRQQLIGPRPKAVPLTVAAKIIEADSLEPTADHDRAGTQSGSSKSTERQPTETAPRDVADEAEANEIARQTQQAPQTQATPATPSTEGQADRDAQATAGVRTPAEPAPVAPSDSDAFSKIDRVDSQFGSVKSRDGRELRLVRPRVDLAFRADATTIGRKIDVVLDITTDATGRPRDVRIVKTSGSEVIDDAVRLAMYDSWFGGKMPDRFSFVIGIR